MTPKEFAEQMNKCAQEYDTECDHITADALLVELIRQLAPEYQEGLDIFENMKKWYA